MQFGGTFSLEYRNKDTGVRGLIQLVRQTIASPWLDYEWLERRLGASFQLRLV